MTADKLDLVILVLWIYKYGLITNEIFLYKNPNDTEISNYISLYGLQQWESPYRMVGYNKYEIIFKREK